MRRLADFGPLSPAEQQLCDEVCEKELVILGDGTRPGAAAGPDRQVRASFLRYLILGGCDALPGVIPERGVRVVGALVTGALDLEGARIPRDVGLFYCRFDSVPNFSSTRIDTLYLNGSALPGLSADRLRAEGDVFLRGVEATGEIRLGGAKLGGDLSCVGASLTAGESGFALFADRLQAEGSVFLREVAATGEIRLGGAKLGGDLDCEGARLTAGDSGKALTADSAEINGAFFLREGARIDGVLDLTAARIGSLIDDAASWPKPGNLILDRCQYGAFTGGPVTAAARIRWLDLQDPARWGTDFWPQPWEHCAKVLREMGHAEAARQVLIAKEVRQRADRRRRRREDGNYLTASWRWFWDTVLRFSVRYGHQPLFAFLWLMMLWGAGVGIFGYAAATDAIKPNNAFVLRSAEWVTCAPGYAPPPGSDGVARNTGGSQLDCFLNQPEAASYPAFNAWVYSADTLLPIVAMEMQEFWIPDETQGTRGRATRVFLWVQIIAGWALSLLAVAGFSGLVRSD